MRGHVSGFENSLVKLWAVLPSMMLLCTTPTERSPESDHQAVASVSVAQDSIVLAIGDMAQSVCQPKNKQGTVLENERCNWRSLDTLVARVFVLDSQTVNIFAESIGQAGVRVEAEGKADTMEVIVPDTVTHPPVPRFPSTGLYVAPNGASRNTGTVDSPWTLDFALAGAGERIRPGDTVWVRGGTYQGQLTSSLAGTSASPIIVRALPGERATLDGALTVLGQHTWVWGLEIFQSTPVATSEIGINAFGVGTRLINNIVHDVGMSGIGFWWNTGESEAYGNIVYNNGTHDNLDHGIYFNNKGPGVKTLRDNIVFNNWAYGLHGYSSTPGELSDITLDGNVAFGGHGLGAYVSPDLMVGGSPVQRLEVINQRTYKPDGYTSTDLGYAGGSATNGSVTVANGYFVGSPGLQLNRWKSVNQSGNINLSYGSPPQTRTIITVRPNAYEPGRAHIVVYNWSEAATVTVDLSSVLIRGQPFTIHNVCNLFGSPAATGTYTGGNVTLSMDALPAPLPIGRTAKRHPPACGGRFAVFLVRSQ